MESSGFPPSWTELVHFRSGHQTYRSHFILVRAVNKKIPENSFAMFALESKANVAVVSSGSVSAEKI